MDYMNRYQMWLNDSLLDEDLREELLSIRGDEDAIRERFFMDIEFGTAGLRGVIGAGSLMMNTYNVKLASEALARTLMENRLADRGVVVACDTRRRSTEFAACTARVLCANGIPVHLFTRPTPVPLLSYAIRRLGCGAGIAITASHNPPQYNGYKAYAADGGQLTPDDCAAVLRHMRSLSCLSDVKIMDEAAARKAGLLLDVGETLLSDYFAQAAKGILCPEAIAACPDLPIVYTPLFGSGSLPVQRLLAQAGFTNLHVVKEQAEPDGDFPGLKAPNPEEEEALALAIRDAESTGAALVIATDPDSDRLAIAIPAADGYRKLSGNQTACLLLYYRLCRLQELRRLPKDGLIVRSIVSTPLADRIAASFGLTVTEVLTGFRYASQQVELAARAGVPFLFAFEESCGYLCVDLSRDKDAVSSALYLCEAAAYYHARKKSLWDVMLEIYDRFGWQAEDVFTAAFPGEDGLERMDAIMERARAEMPDAIAGRVVLAVRDYSRDVRTDCNGAQTPLRRPRSNVLFYELEGGSWACLRPSGTEPKLKIYASAAAASDEESRALLEAILRDCRRWVEA